MREFDGGVPRLMVMRLTIGLAELGIIGVALGILAASGWAEDKTNLHATARSLMNMPPCSATFAKRLSEYSGAFTNTNGMAFVLGDATGEQQVWHFVAALKERQTYRF